MADVSEMTPGEILADSSVADFIRELGLGIAAAQTALDDNSVRQFEAFTTRRDDLGGRSLLDLGLSPAFYHYQHADITCSMQLRMEVGETDELGFAARAGYGDVDRDDGTSNTSETSSESGSRTETKTARLAMRSDSSGALLIDGGRSVTPAGSDPAARLADLRRLLAEGEEGIDTLIATPPDTRPAMALATPTDKVVVSSPTVAFLRPDADQAVIRVRADGATDYVVNPGLTVSTTAQGDVAAYAAHVLERFRAAGFPEGSTTTWSPSARTTFVGPTYATGISALSDEDLSVYQNVAAFLRQTGLAVELEGFTDRQGAQVRNLALGEARARTLGRYLVSQGVPEAQVRYAEPISRGEDAARGDGDANGLDNPEWRKTQVTILDVTDHLVLVSGGPDFDPAVVAPSALADPSAGPDNAYVALFEAAALGLSGNGVTIDGTDFAFSGSAGGGHAAGTAGAHASNLAASVNATDTHRAWVTGNVVRVARAEDRFDVRLFASGTREVRIAESSGFAITEQFSRTTSRITSTDRSSNRTIAVGASIDGRTSRQYGLEVTGNSTISARLVSVPAPPEFLDQIRAYQNGLDR